MTTSNAPEPVDPATELEQLMATIDGPYDPDEVEEQGDTDNPLADYWATLAMSLSAAVARYLDEADGAGEFTCAECGTTDSTTFVVTGGCYDKEGRTEVCLGCHEALEAPDDDDLPDRCLGCGVLPPLHAPLCPNEEN